MVDECEGKQIVVQRVTGLQVKIKNGDQLQGRDRAQGGESGGVPRVAGGRKAAE